MTRTGRRLKPEVLNDPEGLPKCTIEFAQGKGPIRNISYSVDLHVNSE